MARARSASACAAAAALPERRAVIVRTAAAIATAIAAAEPPPGAACGPASSSSHPARLRQLLGRPHPSLGRVRKESQKLSDPLFVVAVHPTLQTGQPLTIFPPAPL